jgi:hypothetical protein
MPNKRGYYLKDLLEDIPLEKYDWVVFGMNDVYTKDPKVDFLPFGIHTGEELARKLSENEHYIIYLGLLAYPKGQASVNKLKTYEDFMNSNSKLAILIDDSSFVNIYVKNEADLHLFEQTVQENDFTDLEYITPGNDFYAEDFSL